MCEQLGKSRALADVEMQIDLPTMHEMVLYWLWLFYVSCHKDKNILGWRHCRIMRAF
jgi:hypothetical protein